MNTRETILTHPHAHLSGTQMRVITEQLEDGSWETRVTKFELYATGWTETDDYEVEAPKDEKAAKSLHLQMIERWTGITCPHCEGQLLVSQSVHSGDVDHWCPCCEGDWYRASDLQNDIISRRLRAA